ncbi:Type 4 prepilin-like proteins leader peptide-processing enzyme (plasmid) [Neomoorella glycerini]|uniref:Type 4 prepilin-like proteins leader peptide-processing enzyme n=1 Tax=Neomoorella glycerini TaxID=55779 RepID=A0A6I5ZWJ3_9FIRM|nr:A24 family peptidase [Moorella glycerini]QGP94134.1 Type 4 prepilin-like proteins leader peptide-processing enzyme [Moorella glycerini]
MKIFLGLAGFACGAILASYAGLLAYRLPRGKSTWGRSRCEACGRALACWELIPLMGFLLVKGRCRRCGRGIPLRYPLAELLLGVLAAWLMLRSVSLLAYFKGMVILTLALAAAMSDLEKRVIPDQVSIALAVAGVFLWWLSANWLAPVGGALLALPLVLLAAFYPQGLGGGDAKFLPALAAALGVAAGAQAMSFAFISGGACALALRVSGRRLAGLPLAPFLFAGTVFALLH